MHTGNRTLNCLLVRLGTALSCFLLLVALQPRLAAAEPEVEVDGAWIDLQLVYPRPLLGNPDPATLWTMVQWQDVTGAWRDADGWGGNPDMLLRKLWWVNPKHYGAGPFRWIAYDVATKNIRAISTDFYLPTHSGDHLFISATLNGVQQVASPPAGPGGAAVNVIPPACPR